MTPSAVSAPEPAGATPPARAALVRSLGVRDLVLLNVVAVTSLRWMATSAAAGPSSLVLWAIAGLFFFVPEGLVVSELTTRYPDGGGVYSWTKRAFGDGHGFFCGWCYFTNNLLYPANLLLSTAVIFTYAIGQDHTALGSSWTYVLGVTLLLLWIATIVNIVGLQSGKWLQNVGAVCTFLPGLILVALGGYAMMTHPSANRFDAGQLVPHFDNFSEINLWASIAFAFTGLELSATMCDEIKEPRRSLPRAVLLSAPLIAGIYILGTVSVLWLVPSKDVNVVSGFLQSIKAGATLASPALLVIVPLCALMFTIGNLGGVGAWLNGPARVAFMIGLDRYFPRAFAKIHPRYKTPHIAILFEAIVATIFLLLSALGKGTTVERAYLILLDTMILLYFIPFVYMFLAYIKLTATGAVVSTPRRLIVGWSGALVTVVGMIVACVPPSDTPSVMVFELKVVGGALAFVVLGLVVYRRGARAGRAAARA